MRNLRAIKYLICVAVMSIPQVSIAAIGASPGERHAVKVVQYLYRLPEVRTHVLRLKAHAGESQDMDETLRLLDQACEEILAGLPKLADPRIAQGLAASAGVALGLVSADLQDLEYDLVTHGKLNLEIKRDLQDVYDLYKELGN